MESLSSPVEPPKKKGKAAAKAKAVVYMPDKMKFIIPFCNQVGVMVNRMHFLKPTSTLHIVKTTIHEVLELYAIPKENSDSISDSTSSSDSISASAFGNDSASGRTSTSSVRFASSTPISDFHSWNSVGNQAACVIGGIKGRSRVREFFQFLEEAVRAQTITTSKPKAKKKELVNLFLTPKPPDETEHPLHKCGLDDTKTKAYQAQLKQLLAAWSCKQHPGSICLVRALNGYHKVLNFKGELVWVLELLKNAPGVDLNTPLMVEYFKWSMVFQWAPSPQQIPLPPPININFLPELMHILRPSSQPPKRMRLHLLPSSDRVASPDVEANPLLQNTPTPTIGVWLTSHS
ncbi:hypothetical protein JB92DRAFT_3108379 [Gautieria morchelliformis]|nr:hypothetical protein JB92DRAFT_3108379 [Gautieria morchelliformis]